VGSGHLDILPETTIVASGSVSANPGEAHLTSDPDDLRRIDSSLDIVTI
jgi:hypothetical protein